MEEAYLDPMMNVKLKEYRFTTKQDRDNAIAAFKCSINDTAYSLKGEERVISRSVTSTP
jgi:hypothetical protein